MASNRNRQPFAIPNASSLNPPEASKRSISRAYTVLHCSLPYLSVCRLAHLLSLLSSDLVVTQVIDRGHIRMIDRESTSPAPLATPAIVPILGRRGGGKETERLAPCMSFRLFFQLCPRMDTLKDEDSDLVLQPTPNRWPIRHSPLNASSSSDARIPAATF